MDSDLILLDDFDDLTNNNQCYNFTNVTSTRCNDCSLILYNSDPHCCTCGNKWEDKSQIFCNKCYRDGKVYFNTRNIDISFVISKFNGYSDIYDTKKQKIYSGELKRGKYDGYGILSEIPLKIKYKGDFKDGEYLGFGILYDNKEIITGLFEKSKLMKKFKTTKNKKSKSISKEFW